MFAIWTQNPVTLIFIQTILPLKWIANKWFINKKQAIINSKNLILIKQSKANNRNKNDQLQTNERLEPIERKIQINAKRNKPIVSKSRIIKENKPIIPYTNPNEMLATQRNLIEI